MKANENSLSFCTSVMPLTAHTNEIFNYLSAKHSHMLVLAFLIVDYYFIEFLIWYMLLLGKNKPPNYLLNLSLHIFAINS